MSNASPAEVLGRHYVTRQPLRLCWDNGIITSLEPAQKVPEDRWLAPALVDVQINGFGGVDFQQDGLSEEQLLSAVHRLCAAGCTRFLLTLITEDWSKLLVRLRHLASVRHQCAELQAAIAGWHIEGPFLSPEPGFRGAHNPALMCDPRPEHIAELRAAAGQDLVLLTLAPERPGALEVIQLAVSQGMKVSLGHTNATSQTLQRAVEAGATAFTHLGNGCPQALDRHDNIIWRVLEISGLVISLIPDQVHVSPPLFRLVHRVLEAKSLFYTTDAMSAAGAPPGRYKLGQLELQVGADQIVRQPNQPYLAGSALRPIDGVFRAAQMLRCPWQQVWGSFSEVPGKVLGLRHELSVGCPADLCLLGVSGENQLSSLEIYVQGKKVERSDRKPAKYGKELGAFS